MKTDTALKNPKASTGETDQQHPAPSFSLQRKRFRIQLRSWFAAGMFIGGPCIIFGHAAGVPATFPFFLAMLIAILAWVFLLASTFSREWWASAPGHLRGCLRVSVVFKALSVIVPVLESQLGSGLLRAVFPLFGNPADFNLFSTFLVSFAMGALEILTIGALWLPMWAVTNVLAQRKRRLDEEFRSLERKLSSKPGTSSANA